MVISARLTSSSARVTARLIRCQLLRIEQLCSTLQSPCSTLHSVMAIGPSMAAMMSVTLISLASLATW
jgi:hypothetical protein